MRDKISILLVDDHHIVRQGIKLLIEKDRGILVVGEADDGQSAIDLVSQLVPDIVIMDITMPGMGGIEATKEIKKKLPKTNVLALTMHDEEQYLIRFLQAGGSGYVRKSVADRELLVAIHAVHQGHKYLQPGAIDLLVQVRFPTNQMSIAPDVLSERERDVLISTVRGFTSREIGQQLNISHRTVETYRKRIMVKLNLKHRSELVDYALKHRLLE